MGHLPLAALPVEPWILVFGALALVALVWAFVSGREGRGALERPRQGTRGAARRDAPLAREGKARRPGPALGAGAAEREAALSAGGEVLIEVRGVTRSWPTPGGEEVVALRATSLVVRRGETLGILGPSGLGKSTLLNLLAGIDFPTQGELRWRGELLPREEGDAIRRHRAEHVALVFQDLNLVTHLTAVENAALPLVCRGERRAAALAQARVHLERLKMGDLLQRLPSQLSGGQKQRVAIARALTSGAPLILADEPTGSLDPETAREVMDAFAELARAEGATVVLVTHDPELAAEYCERIARFTREGLLEVGPARLDEAAGAPRTGGAGPASARRAGGSGAVEGGAARARS